MQPLTWCLSNRSEIRVVVFEILLGFVMRWRVCFPWHASRLGGASPLGNIQISWEGRSRSCHTLQVWAELCVQRNCLVFFQNNLERWSICMSRSKWTNQIPLLPVEQVFFSSPSVSRVAAWRKSTCEWHFILVHWRRFTYVFTYVCLLCRCVSAHRSLSVRLRFIRFMSYSVACCELLL